MIETFDDLNELLRQIKKTPTQLGDTMTKKEATDRLVNTVASLMDAWETNDFHEGVSVNLVNAVYAARGAYREYKACETEEQSSESQMSLPEPNEEPVLATAVEDEPEATPLKHSHLLCGENPPSSSDVAPIDYIITKPIHYNNQFLMTHFPCGQEISAKVISSVFFDAVTCPQCRKVINDAEEKKKAVHLWKIDPDTGTHFFFPTTLCGELDIHQHNCVKDSSNVTCPKCKETKEYKDAFAKANPEPPTRVVHYSSVECSDHTAALMKKELVYTNYLWENVNCPICLEKKPKESISIVQGKQSTNPPIHHLGTTCSLTSQNANEGALVALEWSNVTCPECLKQKQYNEEQIKSTTLRVMLGEHKKVLTQNITRGISTPVSPYVVQHAMEAIVTLIEYACVSGTDPFKPH